VKLWTALESGIVRPLTSRNKLGIAFSEDEYHACSGIRTKRWMRRGFVTGHDFRAFSEYT
jgi:hypothetical protein